jgi:hypothetical protein
VLGIVKLTDSLFLSGVLIVEEIELLPKLGIESPVESARLLPVTVKEPLVPIFADD